MGADVIFKRLLGAATASGDSGALDTTWVEALAVDINITAITGGVTPNITFTLDRLGADGIWYSPVTTGIIAATGKASIDLASALGIAIVAAPLTSGAQHMVLGNTTRLSWVFGGGTPPTSVTFSASIIGRRSN